MCVCVWGGGFQREITLLERLTLRFLNPFSAKKQQFNSLPHTLDF